MKIFFVLTLHIYSVFADFYYTECTESKKEPPRRKLRNNYSFIKRTVNK